MELMVTLIIFALIAAAVITVLVVSTKQKVSTSNEVGSTEMGRTALDMMSRDLRCAGFGVDQTYSTPQPPIAYVDSTQILINADLSPYPDTSTTQRGQPLAYNPNGNPRPYPLNGTSWTPPIRYRTGAETIRWTLDLNNDGVVDANDFSSTDAADANRTPNPNDYELCREVYGDSTAGAAGNNGGSRERIALIKKPGSSQPPLFRVYMEGSSTPWDWANGPVPANRLAEIVRIEIHVVATSPTKGFNGQYTDRAMTTTVNEIRNAPNFSATTYTVSGVVFNDANKNYKQDGAPEPGISGAQMTLGGYLSQSTGATGAFSFSVPPGAYTLTQDPPDNFGIYTSPDSFTVIVGPNTVCNFADTSRAGGWVTVTVFNDVNKDKKYASPDTPMLDLPVTLNGSTSVYNTDSNGQAVIFAPVGNYSISAALPDSFIFSTANPATGTMTNGASKTAAIGMYIYDSGTVSGTVYSDANGNGTQDGGENGVPNVMVSCTLPDSTYLYTYTDSHGNYALKLPTNDPPHTTPYTIVCNPAAGYALGKTTIPNIWVQTNKTLSSQDFPMGKFTLWQHDTDIPMSALAACDFIENDWTGGQTKHAHQDVDLVTGADGPSTWSLEQWFNQYDKTPLFQGNSNVKRSVPYSVYAIATDTLMAGSNGFTRPDVVCGMRYRPSGNWTIWYTQNGTGNEGFLPNAVSQSYLTLDNGDVASVVTVPPAAGASPDIIVGTRSPSSGQGTIEVWKAASHSNPVYVRSQVIPTTGAVPGNNLGEVASMVVADVDANAAGPELVVGTLTGYYSGQVMVFKNVAGTWTYDWGTTLASDAVTSVIAIDVDNDNRLDIVAGTQNGHSSGKLYYWKNKGGNPVSFNSPPVTKTASGIVTCLEQADYGGDGIEDILVGWRDSDLTFGGGLQIWYTTTKTLPASGADPSGGAIQNWVTDIVVANFNYGVWPATPSGTALVDIACTTRKDTNHGQLFTLIR